MKYISLLRGINVGGKRPLPMVELKKLLSGMGMKKIVTYIQSGNVIFQSDISDYLAISRLIEESIDLTFGYEVPVITIPVNDFLEKIKLNPYLKDTESNRLHISFLETEPTQDSIDILNNINVEPESFSLVENVIFIRCKNKFASQSRLTNTFFESKLKVKTTTRNWKTITKIKDIASQAD